MDFKIYENGDGAELNIINGNIEIEKGFSNSIYLSLFSNDNWYNIYEKYKTTNDFETALNTLVISKMKHSQMQMMVQTLKKNICKIYFILYIKYYNFMVKNRMKI